MYNVFKKKTWVLQQKINCRFPMSSYSVTRERNRTFEKRLCSCFKFVAQKKIKAHWLLRFDFCCCRECAFFWCPFSFVCEMYCDIEIKIVLLQSAYRSSKHKGYADLLLTGQVFLWLVPKLLKPVISFIDSSEFKLKTLGV